MESVIVKSKNTDIDFITLQKMKFIYNSILNGWSVEMKNNQFHFIRKHEGEQEIYSNEYLNSFINTNLN